MNVVKEAVGEMVAQRQRDLVERVAKSGFRDPAAAYIRRLVRSAGEGGGCIYDDPGAQKSVFDGVAAEATFVVSTARSDRYCDNVIPKGCLSTLKDYQANPVVFFGHKSDELPIGTSLDLQRQRGVSVDDMADKGICKFHLKTQESEDVCKLVEADELRCASIGFMPILAEVLEPATKALAGSPDEVALLDFTPWVAFRFLEWSIYEWSIVPVPANPDCISMRLSRGFGGKPLSDKVAKALEPFAAPLRSYATGNGGGHVAKIDSPPPIPPVGSVVETPPPLPVVEQAAAAMLTLAGLKSVLAELKSLGGIQSEQKKQLRLITGKVD